MYYDYITLHIFFQVEINFGTEACACLDTSRRRFAPPSRGEKFGACPGIRLWRRCLRSALGEQALRSPSEVCEPFSSPCRLRASSTRSAAGMRTFFLGYASETRLCVVLMLHHGNKKATLPGGVFVVEQAFRKSNHIKKS